MTNEWFYTDDYQICRKVKEGVYEFIEFNQVDDLMISSRDKVIVANWKDSDGEWDNDTISIIQSYYGSLYYETLYEMRRRVNKEDEEQIVAEMIFESTSCFDDDSLELSEEEAEKYLDGFVYGNKEE